MDKVFQIQNQARNNVKELQTYMTDLQNWEAEMKRKEAALNGAFEQDLPPVRSKIKKEKPVVPIKKPEQKIKGSDYSAWDKYDVDKACEDIDMEDVGPTSLDGKKSQQAKLEKLKEEAQYEKERGNTFVKQEKWDEAISCYNRAIELVKDDAIYYANRGLCYLKKDSLHQAESDCSEALRLDPTYVKALQRRATARERLGSLRAASHDLNEVLKLEPHNTAARKQLEAIKTRMGTKGRPLKSIPIQEVLLGEKTPEKPPTRLKIVDIEDNLSQGDSNNNDSNKKDSHGKIDACGEGEKKIASPESVKLVSEAIVTEKIKNFVPPVNMLTTLLEDCKQSENCTDEVIADLKNKYEL
ncbi:hypothetical protein HF086_014370 [Spodoptera exigua]|uniref:Uncharacterized protein n=1 Tax=Spodoptera exigua TaxID=7107 RepID=A0A922M8C6_SPOEX|nr:hypothetical protein HF086_014370 [Spodoptera exigua]